MSQSLAKMMGSEFRDYWRRATGYQKLLCITGLLLLLSAAFHTVVLIVTGGTLEGDVSFRKAISFGEAFGLTAISLAWFLTFLPERRTIWWPLSSIYAIATFAEVFLVTMQVWRGVPSHFNFSTPFDAAVFGLMGVSISLHAPLIVGVLIGSLFFCEAPTSMKWAVASAMVFLMASIGFGVVMIVSNSNTIGLAGQMKIPHALALHAAQIFPLVALLLKFTDLSEGKRTKYILSGVIGYTVLVAVTAVQAFNGVAMSDLGAGTLLILFAGVAILGMTFFRTLLALRSRGKLV